MLKVIVPVLFTLCLTILTAFASPAQASRVTLEDGSHQFVSIEGSGPETFVFINGLEYETTRWDAVTRGLVASGAKVIRYALPGQPENLRLLKKGDEPAFFKSGLELTDMAHQLEMILRAAHISKPVHVVGLSYGASVAATFSRLHPELVSDTTFLSPLVVPLDSYNVGGQALHTWLQGIRDWEQSPCELYGAINPYLCVGQTYYYDQLYTALYQSYLMDRIQSTPKGIDPTLFKKGVYHLVRAVRDFDLKNEIAQLHHVSMLVASEEDKDLGADQKRAWALVPRNERVESAVFQGAHHALPDEAPEHVVEELLKIAALTRAAH